MIPLYILTPFVLYIGVLIGRFFWHRLQVSRRQRKYQLKHKIG